MERICSISPSCSGFSSKDLTRIRQNENKKFLGDVGYGLLLDPGFSGLKVLLNKLKMYGYVYKKCLSYRSPVLSSISGSVGLHVDAGMGLVASWLIKKNSIGRYSSMYPPELIVQGKGLDVNLGDVFVFNANQKHCWISNDHCSLIQVTVRRSKTKPSYE